MWFAPLRPWIRQERIRIESLLDNYWFSIVTKVDNRTREAVGSQFVRWGPACAVVGTTGRVVGYCRKRTITT